MGAVEIMKVSITHIDTACCLIEAGGIRILTDPVFDPPGHTYHHGWGAFSKKTSAPALAPEELGNIDLVLLSHHQHKDNLDNHGKEVLATVRQIVSTKAAARKLACCAGLAPGQRLEFPAPSGNLTITGTACRHHPRFLPEFLSGPVTGFLLQWPGFEAIYISGDTVLFPPLYEIGKKVPVGLALIHVGRASFPYLTGWGKYTMDGNDYIRLMESLQPEIAIPIHNGGWTHFKENDGSLAEKLEHFPEIKKRTAFIGSGIRRDFELRVLGQ